MLALYWFINTLCAWACKHTTRKHQMTVAVAARCIVLRRGRL